MGASNFEQAPFHIAAGRMAPGEAGIPLNSAPSLVAFGFGIQDHRWPINAHGYSAAEPGALGWYGATDPLVIDQVPSAISTNNIATAAANASIANGTPMTLVSSSAGGITVLSAAQAFLPNPVVGAAQNVVPVGACIIDGLPGIKLFGGGAPGVFSTAFYDPTTMIARCVSITGASGAAAGNFLVKGYDVYGFPMSSQVAYPGGATTVNTSKAFKAVTSVTPLYADAHAYSVGTSDLYGLPMACDRFSHLYQLWGETVQTTGTNFSAANTSAATSTTGDVRGIIGISSPSNGTNRLVVYLSPSLSDLANGLTAGLYGQTQA
jgi:hypothetical protein